MYTIRYCANISSQAIEILRELVLDDDVIAHLLLRASQCTFGISGDDTLTPDHALDMTQNEENFLRLFLQTSTHFMTELEFYSLAGLAQFSLEIIATFRLPAVILHYCS